MNYEYSQLDSMFVEDSLMIELIPLVIFFVAILIQLFYQLYYFSKLVGFKPLVQIQTHQAVSVIVCAQNEFENLQKLIPALLSQNYHHYEIILVNDRSYDGTYDYLESIKNTSDKLKIIHIEDTPQNMDGKKYALTLGIKAAKYEILLFTDADCMPFTKNWILQMQAHHSSEQTVVLGVSQFEKESGFLNRFIRFDAFYAAVQYLSFALKGVAYMGVGRNLSYQKKVYFENKGFYPYMHVTGGDDDLFVGSVSKGNNVTINPIPDAQTTTPAKNTLKTWFYQKKRHISVSKLYKLGYKVRLGLLNLSQALMILSLVPACMVPELGIYAGYAYLFRTFVLLYQYKVIVKKLAYNVSIWFLPVFEILYIAYLFILGTSVLFSKKVQWR